MRLSPTEPPLTAASLSLFYRTALREFSRDSGQQGDTAINFYEKAGVAHFVYRDGCRTYSWGHQANNNRFKTHCTKNFDGTYHAVVTSFGEEWVRCTTQVPAYATSLSAIDLGLDWISCAAYANATAAEVTDGRLAASRTPVGGVARVKAASGANRWIVVGSDAYLRSPAEVAAEATYGVPGLPQESGEFCARAESVTLGGSPFGCNQVTVGRCCAS